MSIPATTLQASSGEQLVLQGVHINGELTDMLSQVEVRQSYANHLAHNIEAVYTFPLPGDSVLTSLQVQIGERYLKGVVVEKQQAEQRYEDAMVDGDSAVMLQQTHNGLYTMHVGNLMPGEKIHIVFSYCQLHAWQDDSMRFHLPTVIAPRYGDSGLQPYLEPAVNSGVEHGFSLQLLIKGKLAHARMHSPSHTVRIAHEGEGTRVSLAEGAALDRDFVLNVVADQAQKNLAVWTTDGEEYVAMAAFHPRFPAIEESLPRCLKIVVDCSSSMAGDSIKQAKNALREIIQLLRPQDCFALLAFGSHTDVFDKNMLPAGERTKHAALRWIDSLEANLGGTEIGAALQQAYNQAVPKTLTSDWSADVLLITDGEVWQGDTIVDAACRSGHRIFSVGVGSAVSEGFVRDLALGSGGACELVAPNESMAEHIVRHAKRIYFPRAGNVHIHWPVPVLEQVRAHEVVYDGDTVVVFGRFAKPPQGQVSLELSLGGGQQWCRQVGLERHDLDVLPRYAAWQKMQNVACDSSLRLQLALRYQLICEQTHVLVIDQRQNKATDMPELVKVPQMLAAGWGGSGSVMADACESAMPSCVAASVPPPAQCSKRRLAKPTTLLRGKKFKKQSLEPLKDQAGDIAGMDLLANLVNAAKTGQQVSSLQVLQDLSVPPH